MQYITIILIAMFIEAIVTAIKPLWSKEDGKKMSVAEIVSIVIGIVLAVSCKLNMLAYFADETFLAGVPPWVLYIFYVLTGIALGRGPSFIWDLWQRIKKAAEGEPVNYETVGYTDDGYILPPLEDWPLEMIVTFCKDNGIPCEGAQTKDEFIRAITQGGKAEPPNEAAQNTDE